MIDKKPSNQEFTIMSTIPISVTEKQFQEHIEPSLSKAKRGLVCKIALYKVFNYILYRLHTGSQWAQLPIDPDPNDTTKRRSAGKRSTTTFRSGAPTGVWRRSGITVSRLSNP